jgi:hypothetical protein
MSAIKPFEQLNHAISDKLSAGSENAASGLARDMWSEMRQISNSSPMKQMCHALDQTLDCGANDPFMKAMGELTKSVMKDPFSFTPPNPGELMAAELEKITS